MPREPAGIRASTSLPLHAYGGSSLTEKKQMVVFRAIASSGKQMRKRARGKLQGVRAIIGAQNEIGVKAGLADL